MSSLRTIFQSFVIVHTFQKMKYGNLFLLTLSWLTASPAVSEYEIPTKKAIPPKMDPIPTLPQVTHRAYFDIQIDGKHTGRIVLGLFGDIAPKAVENFLGLCNCDKGKAKVTGKELCYKGTTIHRIIPNFMFQGGDFTHEDGTGGESIFGQAFEDESYQVKFNRRYMLSMANSGTKNSNRSQFFINTVKTQWLDGKSVIFGMVLEGSDVMIEIEKSGTFGGQPTKNVIISNSGSLKLKSRDKELYPVSWRLES